MSPVQIHGRVKIIEHSDVSPPPNSAPPTFLPLTYFDIPWLFFSPSQTLFFYKFPHPTPHFTTTILPILKHSLSLTLQHFHPLAGNLFAPPKPSKPHLVYAEGDSVSLIVAESDTNDFNHLSGNHSREVSELYSLLPRVHSPSQDCSLGTKIKYPLMAVQITRFGDMGMSIGLAVQHVVADERTFNHFMKAWASTSKSLLLGQPLISIKSPQWYDRSVIIDSNELESALLNQWWNQRNTHKVSKTVPVTDSADMVQVRATFVLSPADMDKIKQTITDIFEPSYLSPYTVVCSFVWVCLIKAQTKGLIHVPKQPVYFGFNAGGITRLGYKVPPTYFGNSVAFGRSKIVGSEVAAEDGIAVAAEAIGRTITELNNQVLEGGKRWISDWEMYNIYGENHEHELNVRVVGSPKVDIYEMDFGLGRPNKIEKMSSLDCENLKAISLLESRDLKGGMEVGVVLPKAKMEAFTSLFNGGLV